jgi:hypothetical protein
MGSNICTALAMVCKACTIGALDELTGAFIGASLACSTVEIVHQCTRVGTVGATDKRGTLILMCALQQQQQQPINFPGVCRV